MLRLLANENFPGDAVAELRLRAHDVAWIRLDSPGVDDDAVLSRAVTEGRLLVTFDKDFGELVFRRGREASVGVVLFRIALPTPSSVVRRIVQALESRDDWSAMFSVVEDARIRMVPLPASTAGAGRPDDARP
jgi:predicted nuclease of predicted toxin-antitoxin system